MTKKTILLTIYVAVAFFSSAQSGILPSGQVVVGQVSIENGQRVIRELQPSNQYDDMEYYGESNEWTIPSTILISSGEEDAEGNEIYHSCIVRSVWFFQSYATSLSLPNTIDELVLTGERLESVNIPSVESLTIAGLHSLDSLILPSYIGHIQPYFLAGCPGLSYVQFPDSVGIFGGLTDNAPECVKSISFSMDSLATNAFFNCTTLVSFTPSSCRAIGSDAFSGCSSLDTLTLPRNLRVVRDGSLGLCNPSVLNYNIDIDVEQYRNFRTTLNGMLRDIGDSIEVVNFGEHVKYVPAEMFSRTLHSGSLSLTTVHFSSSNTQSVHIGTGAFERCYRLTSVTLPPSLEVVGSGAFSGCRNIAMLDIPSTITHIGDSAFQECTGLGSINLPNLYHLGEKAFAHSDLSAAFLGGDSIRHIPPGTFFNCANLQSVTLPPATISINDYAFTGTSIDSISFPATLSNIGYMAFAFCRNITSVNIPYTTELEDAAFAYSDGIESVNIVGSSNDSIFPYYDSIFLYYRYWSISVPTWSLHRMYLVSRLYSRYNINADSMQYEEYVNAHMEELLQMSEALDQINFSGVLPFDSCDNLSTVTIGAGVEYSSTFFSAPNLSTINLYADSCRYVRISSRAPISEVHIGENVRYVPQDFVRYAPAISHVTIPRSVKTIGQGAFAECPALTSVDFNADSCSEAYSAFEDNINLTTVNIGVNVRNIPDYIFERTGIKNLVIPDSVRRIGKSAFGDCDSLRTLVIGEGVDSIGIRAFANCTQLNWIQCESEIPPVATSASFLNVDTTIFVYVPCSSVELYANAPGWNRFPNIRCGELPIVADTFTVAAMPSDTAMGTVTGGGVYADGATATLTAIPAPCHQFSGWGDGVADNPRSLTVNADTTITAIFAPIAAATGDVAATACDSYTWNGQTYTASGTYTFATSTVAGCDSIATLSLTLNYSVADTLEATATESYDWNGQTYTESGAYTYSGTTVHGCDSTVTLLLTIEPPVVYYTVTVASSDDAMGSVLGGGTYEAGTEVTLTAMPAEGHEFVQWSDGLANNPRTLVLTSDTTFTAQFQPEVGIQHPTSDLRLTIHPNPTRSTVTLSGLEPGAKVTIVDLNGREVLSLTTDDSTLTTDVSSLTSGAYFVRVTGERQTAVRKLIVK